MHGGASGSGAPRGNKNAFKHGKYSMDTIKTVKKVNQMVEAWTRLCQKMEDHEG
jgi:glucans biosynthesis protein